MTNNISVNQVPSPFNWEFNIQNTSGKDIRVFNVTISPRQVINLMSIPFVTEDDIKKSLFKGELLNRINAGEIQVISSNVNLQGFSSDFSNFSDNNNIPHNSNAATESSYAPSSAANWSPVPTMVDEALDTLAANASLPPVATDVGKSISAYRTLFIFVFSTTFFNTTLQVSAFPPSDIYTFVPGGTTITVLETGLYLISFRASFENFLTERGSGAARIAINGNPVNYTTVYSFNRNDVEAEGTGKYSGIFSLNSGDVIQLQIARADVNPTVLALLPGTGISLNFLR